MCKTAPTAPVSRRSTTTRVCQVPEGKESLLSIVMGGRQGAARYWLSLWWKGPPSRGRASINNRKMQGEAESSTEDSVTANVVVGDA